MLLYLKRYFELLVMFDAVDASDDRRLNFAEFEMALPQLASWGVQVRDPEAEWRAMDADGGGKVLFDEFSGWALERGLSMGYARAGAESPDRDREDLGELRSQHKLSSDAVRRHGSSPPRRKAELPDRVLPGLISIHSETQMHELIDRLPCGKSEADRAARDELFGFMDTDLTGILYPHHVDLGLRLVLADVGQTFCESPMPAIEPAFKAVTQFKPLGRKFLKRGDFLPLLRHLKWYSNPLG